MHAVLTVGGKRLEHLWDQKQLFRASLKCGGLRSHAQKYFLKVQKNGTNEHLSTSTPSRQKRKAAHPCFQKASDSSLLPSNSIIASMPSWTDHTVQAGSLSQMKKGSVFVATCMRGTFQPVTNNYCISSSESTPTSKSTHELIEGHRDLK
nr:protein REVEILLE 6-like [Nicotiana tomentosiformis]